MSSANYNNYLADLKALDTYLNDEKDSYKRSSACYKMAIKYPEYYKNCRCNCCSCFGGDGLVLMNDGSYKPVFALEKNDIVFGGAKIVCKLVFNSSEGVDIVEYKDMLITPFHPIKVNGLWTFPIDVCDSHDMKLTTVYNFILDSKHIIIVNDVECVTLGHNFTGDIIEHPYFGSNKIVDDLKNKDGWGNGLIVFNDVHVIRDDKGLVCKLL